MAKEHIVMHIHLFLNRLHTLAHQQLKFLTAIQSGFKP